MIATSWLQLWHFEEGRLFKSRSVAAGGQCTVTLPQHFLCIFPEPHGQGSFRPTLGAVRIGRRDVNLEPPPTSRFCWKYRYAPTSPAAICTMTSSRFLGLTGSERISGSSSCSWQSIMMGITPRLWRKSMISRTCCLLPRASDSLSTLGADPVHRLQCGDPVLDYGQDLGSEASDQLLRQNRPDPFHQAATQVSLDPRDRGWRHGLHGVRLELQPVFLVPDPPAPCDQPFPSGYRGQRPDDRGLLQVDPVSSGTGQRAQDTEAALFVVKSDALDQTGDFLGRGLAFRECGGHRWEFILPRESAGGGVRKAIQGRFG